MTDSLKCSSFLLQVTFVPVYSVSTVQFTARGRRLRKDLSSPPIFCIVHLLHFQIQSCVYSGSLCCSDFLFFFMYCIFLPLAPHPSEQIQKLIGRLCLDDDKLTNEFLNGMLNQLNWAFSEFIGMLQEVRLVTTVISVYFGRSASSSLFILRNTRAHTLHKHDSHSTYRNSYMNTTCTTHT